MPSAHERIWGRFVRIGAQCPRLVLSDATFKFMVLDDGQRAARRFHAKSGAPNDLVQLGVR